MTMTAIQHIELTSSQSSITFSAIPQTFTDLYLVVSARNSNAVNDNEIVQLRFNSDSGGNYTNRTLLGTGSSAVSQTTGTTYINALRCPSDGRTSNTFSNIGIYIPNYTSSAYKSVSSDGTEETNATAIILGIGAGLWSSTSAINTITLNFGLGDFKQYSSATLFGILKGSDGVTSVS